MRFGRRSTDAIFALLAAALFGLFAAGCSAPEDTPSVGAGSIVAFSADTAALAEGRRLLDGERYDLARERLMESALSEDRDIRIESFMYLNVLEMKLGNHDAALVWLERYHIEAMELFRQALDAEERIDLHEEKTRRSIGRLRWLVGGVVCVMVSVVAVAMWERRRRIAAVDGGSRSSAPPDFSVWRHHLASAEAFMKRPVFAEIAELERQPADRRARVLSHSRQEILDGELAEVFSEFIAVLRAACPSLTAGDVKLCCLSLVPLSAFGRAICFGSTETNIIKQRKHKIKKKMGADEGSHSLFDFIFAPRSVRQIPHL